MLAVGLALVAAMAATGCQRAPSRDAGRDDRLADRFSRIERPRHRLVKPIPVPPDERSEDDGVNPIAPGGPTGPTPEVHWVTEMAAGDPVTALTRRDDLTAAGRRGYDACAAWLAHYRDGLVAGATPPGDVIRVLACLRQMVDAAPGRHRPALAAALVPLTADARPRRLRLAAWDLLARVYTAAEAPALARGLLVDDAVTNSRIAEALTVHVTRVELPSASEEPGARVAPARSSGARPVDVVAPGSPSFSGEDWPRLPPILSVRLTLRPETREVELVGLLDPATELQARTVSSVAEWQDALTRLADRSRAALQAAEEVWHQLDHDDVVVRSRAAHCLRLMSGQFAGFRSTADPLARELAIARWSARLVRMLPGRSREQAGRPGTPDRRAREENSTAR